MAIDCLKCWYIMVCVCRSCMLGTTRLNSWRQSSWSAWQPSLFSNSETTRSKPYLNRSPHWAHSHASTSPTTTSPRRLPLCHQVVTADQQANLISDWINLSGTNITIKHCIINTFHNSVLRGISSGKVCSKLLKTCLCSYYWVLFVFFLHFI